MIYELRLPNIVPQMTGATIECLYAAPGDMMRTGSKLVDLKVDLSSAFAQECPPVSYFRMVLREPAYLQSLAVGPGGSIAPGELLAVFTTSPDEKPDALPARPIRMTIAGIMAREDMLDGTAG